MLKWSFRTLCLGVLGATLLSFGSGAAAKGPDHTAFQTRPSFLGVSGSGIAFLNVNGSLYCYAGTLGSLVEIGNSLYVLSNNHVLAGESSTGHPRASVGDWIIQPGLLDENGDPNSCSPPGTDYTKYKVGQLSDWVPLDFSPTGTNDVDAAIASVASKCTSTGYDQSSNGACIDENGRILEIGGLSGYTVPTSGLVGTAVQKSGRTTGLTTGVVGAIDANIKVSYDYGTAQFVNQILISGDHGAFIKAGDSGSLAVTRPTNGTMPDAVGLLFAGSRNGIAIANPIDAVLSELGVNMVRCDSSKVNCADTGVTSGGGGGGAGGHSGNKPSGTGGPHFSVRGLDVAAGVLDRHRDDLMTNPDVVGTGLGADRDGTPVIQVYTKGAIRSVNHPIPSQLEGVKVEVVVTGEFKAL